MREYTARKTQFEIKVTTLNGETRILKTVEPVNASRATKIGKDWIKYEEVQQQKADSVNSAKKELTKYVNSTNLNDKDKKRIKELEDIIENNRPDDSPYQLAKELTYVYTNVDPNWLLDNFDIMTLQEILKDIAEELAGLKKDVTN